MKKILAFCVIFILMLCITACNADNKITKSASKSTVDSSSQLVSTATEAIVETDFFSVKTPIRWEKDCGNEIIKDEDGYSLAFYDKASEKTGMGGWLFSINLFDEDLDYTVFPAYEILGSIDIGEKGKYNIVITYPTDVGFSEETAKKYLESTEEIPDIIKNITYKDGCKFSENPIPVKSVTE